MNNVTYNSPIMVIESIDIPHRFIYLVFVQLLLFYLIILTANIGVMLLIIMDRNLQQPMYLLFFSLSFNDVMGSTVLLPRKMLDVVSINPSISYSWCVSQAFFSHTYGASCHTIMTIMAFDRYVAICHPLRYSSIMNPSMVAKLTVSAWSTSITLVLIEFSLTIQLKQRCRSVIIYACNNPSLFKLFCEDVTINNLIGLIWAVLVFSSSIGSVAYTYFRILSCCVSKKNKELNRKAIQTCSSHLVLYMIMLWSGFLIVISDRVRILNRYRPVVSMLFHIIPPIVNPVIYAMQTKELKTKIVQVLNSKVTQQQ